MKQKKIATGRGRREDRQREATERNAAYRALSVKDRLYIVLGRNKRLGGHAFREVARLNALLDAQENTSGTAEAK